MEVPLDRYRVWPRTSFLICRSSWQLYRVWPRMSFFTWKVLWSSRQLPRTIDCLGDVSCLDNHPLQPEVLCCPFPATNKLRNSQPEKYSILLYHNNFRHFCIQSVQYPFSIGTKYWFKWPRNLHSSNPQLSGWASDPSLWVCLCLFWSLLACLWCLLLILVD